MRMSEVLAAIRPTTDGFWASVPDTWTQGRTLFGGMQAALLVRAMRSQLEADIPLRSLQTTFVAPVAPGTVDMRVRILRRGKSATHVEAQILDGAQVACTAVAVFGRSRPSPIAIQPVPPKVAVKPAHAVPWPYVPGVSAAFSRHMEKRYARGSLPFTGGSEARTQVYVRFVDEPRMDEALIVALSDAIPTPATSLLQAYAPASSMAWTLEMLDDHPETLPADYFLLDAEVTAARDGYGYQTVTVWSSDGRAVALSRQSTVIFA